MRELGRRMDAREWHEWAEYAALFPDDKTWWQPMRRDAVQQSPEHLRAALTAMAEESKRHGGNSY